MSDDRQLIVALAGGVGSGKSTIARLLAEKLQGRVAGFGDFVRSLAEQSGANTDRPSLQEVGQSRVAGDTGGFVRGFIEWAAPPKDCPFIIDGVRHAAVDSELRKWAAQAGRPYFLILLATPDEARAARRSKGDMAELHRIDAHPVERETSDRLPSLAEITVDGTGDLDQVIANIATAAPAILANALR